MKLSKPTLAVLFLVLSIGISYSQIPKTMSYQAVLTNTDGSKINEGSYTILFRLYDDTTAVQPLWEESQQVQVTQGVISVILGSIIPLDLPFDQQYWLGITIGGDPELKPRITLAASPYALRARSVAGGVNSFPEEGNVGIGVVSPTEALEVKGNIRVSEKILAGAFSSTSPFIIEAPEGTERARIDDLTGNFGIGVNPPEARLHIGGEPGVDGIKFPDGTLQTTATAGDGHSLDAADGDPQDVVFVDELGVVTINSPEVFIGSGINDTKLYLFSRPDGSVEIIFGNENFLIRGGIFYHNPSDRMFFQAHSGFKFTAGPDEFVEMTGFKMPTGAGPGLVLTSDASGVGRWQAAPGGGNGGAGWGLFGNAGTNPLNNFLGTTDNVPFVVRVNSQRALRIEPTDRSPNLIGGFNGNSVSNGVVGAVISGGGENGFANRITDHFGVVAGGEGNQAGDDAGDKNDALLATVAGGFANMASGAFSTVAGGQNNIASGDNATVSGGAGNDALGSFSTVSGGSGNEASGDYSFAAGNYAKALNTNTFVWSDGTLVDPEDVQAGWPSTADNQFLISATGGVGIGKNDPQEQLDVDGTVQMTGIKMTTDPINGFVLTSNADGVGKWQAPGADGDWEIAGDDMYSAVAGNVGIGNDDPAAKLHVSGVSDLNENGGGILLVGDAAGFSVRIDRNEIQAYTGGKATNATLFLQNEGTGNLNVGNGTLFVSKAGRVGILTNNPKVIGLDIEGKLRIGVVEETSEQRLLVWSEDNEIVKYIDAKNLDIVGAQGEQGPIGQIGPIGPIGVPGPPGLDGVIGPQGEQGLQGFLGPQGQQGPQGDQGTSGSTGPTGPAGATGPPGPTGPEGAKGDNGATGATGSQGLKGDKGDTGATGPPGTSSWTDGTSDVSATVKVIAGNNLEVTGSENTGSTAALRIQSGSQTMLLDGNEIDATSEWTLSEQ